MTLENISTIATLRWRPLLHQKMTSKCVSEKPLLARMIILCAMNS